VLIDAPLVVMKSYFGIRADLKLKDGTVTKGLYGYLTTLIKFMAMKPDYLVAAFEGGRSFRKDINPGYKENRVKTKDECLAQIQMSMEASQLLGIPALSVNTFEADDVIATLAKEAERKGYFVTIVSLDKDLMQLVSPNIVVASTNGKDVFNEEVVRLKFGVPAKYLADYQALIGDRVDNIKAIPQLGKVAAAEFINQYGSLENVLRNLEADSTQRELNLDEQVLVNFKERSLNSLKLTTLRCDVSGIENIESYECKFPEESVYLPVLEKLEMQTLIKSIKSFSQNQ
jgi:DNA polymerase-1